MASGGSARSRESDLVERAKAGGGGGAIISTWGSTFARENGAGGSEVLPGVEGCEAVTREEVAVSGVAEERNRIRLIVGVPEVAANVDEAGR